MIKLKDILNEVINPQKVYHTTTKSRLDSILKDGLKVNSEKGFSMGSLGWMKTAYKMVPIFVSLKPGKYKEETDGVILEIDASGLELVADIPGLSDIGAYIEDNYIWFEEGGEPFEMNEEDEGQIYFRDLINPNNQYCQKSIETTETAAIMENIPPTKIKVVG